MEHQSMMDLADIQELYRYNQWANDRVFDAVCGLSLNDFTKDLDNSFPSVRDTLTHLVWAEWIWLQRWKGTSPQQVFAATEFPHANALKARWLEVEAAQNIFLGAVTTERLRAVVAYVNQQGQSWRYPLWRQMYHVVNHSTYHRGQLTAMLRQLGAMPVATDFLVFHDELETRPSDVTS
jgi:uncharacterized damage-inducible protein DinB